MNIAAIITAAGSSSRMYRDGAPQSGGIDGAAQPGGLKKEYRPLGNALDPAGRPLTVLGAAVSAFASLSLIKIIVITVPSDPAVGEIPAREALPRRLLEGGSGPKILFVPGGKTRRASVHHALSLLAAYDPAYVLIHDGARPWVSPSLIEQLIEGVKKYHALIPLLPLTETPKEIEGSMPSAGELISAVDGPVYIKRHLRRSNLGSAQTPQAFAFPDILRAHEKAAEKELAQGFDYTDDAEVWGEFIGPVALIPGDPENRKITFREDFSR